ncbi:MAG: quinone oxidoreductase [Dehalococcoidia bacterium]|jgi:NADPH:quinone reductase|nr:quinone oxidoreductase [Dehalococcoidia bacterium]
MRAAVVSEFGPFDAIRVQELETPAAGDGEIVVRTSVAGVNFADAGMVTGAARRKEPPFVPGVEASGVVESVGVGVTELSVGQRVVYWNPMPAAFAEFAVVPGWRCVAIPEGVSDEAAVTLMVQGTTAHYLAMDSAPLEAGMNCLVYAAAGGVGHLLVQVANQLGARVIAVVGNEGKAGLARELGADVVIDRSGVDILEAVREATGGEGVDAVYDAVGAATIEQSLLATKRRGTCVLYGGASGPVGMLDTSLMQQAGSIFFTRPGLGDHLRDAEEYQRRMGDLFEWHSAGVLTPRMGGEWGLEGVPEALSAIAGGGTTGKLLIRV